MAGTNSPVESGRSAFDAHAWRTAREALAAARATSPLGERDLWRLAIASFLVGDEDLFVHALQDAHRVCMESGDTATAARHAVWLGFHFINRGDTAQASGWFGRAARLVDQVAGSCAAAGYLVLAEGHRQLVAGEPERCIGAATEAAAIGQRFEDRDLFALSLHLQGRARIRMGDVAQGLAVLDEAMVSVATGELSPQVTGLIYCGVIGGCREVYALRRAHEWTVSLAEWCERQPEMVPYAGECGVYRSELLQLRGDWEAAMDEALLACDRLERGHEPKAMGLALYQRAELHRLRGEFSAAENAYRAASLTGREPQPGLALLRMTQGDTAAAESALRRALAETTDRLRRARLLPAYVEVLLETGDLKGARGALAEFEQIASGCADGCLGTIALQVQGAVALASNDAAGALAPLRRALHEWQALHASYEAARVRTLLSRACRALGDREGEELESIAARAAFEHMGARPDLARLDTLRQQRAPGPAHGLTPREREVLACLATGRTNRQIGDMLGISERTVARHVANLFAKIGVSTRTAATAFAFRHGLASSPAQN